MKKSVLKIIIPLLFSAFSAPSNAATVLNRSDFGPQAVEYGFDNGVLGDATAGDGNLLVSTPDNQGIVFDSNDPDFVGTFQLLNMPLPIYLKTAQGTKTIRMDFEQEPIGRFGFNFLVINNDQPSPVFDLTLSLFDENNNQLGFYNLTGANQTSCNMPVLAYSTCGFIGLGINSNTIAFASVDYTFIGTSPIDETIFRFGIDNIIYQLVPTPGIIWLIGAGLPGLLLARKKISPAC